MKCKHLIAAIAAVSFCLVKCFKYGGEMGMASKNLFLLFL